MKNATLLPNERFKGLDNSLSSKDRDNDVAEYVVRGLVDMMMSVLGGRKKKEKTAHGRPFHGCDTSAFSPILSSLVPVVSASHSTIMVLREREGGWMNIKYHLFPSFPTSLLPTATGYIVSLYSTTTTTTTRGSNIFSPPFRVRANRTWCVSYIREIYYERSRHHAIASCSNCDDIKQRLPPARQMKIQKWGIRTEHAKNNPVHIFVRSHR